MPVYAGEKPIHEVQSVLLKYEIQGKETGLKPRAIKPNPHASTSDR